ncbi:17-beta-hydroxysteroid dehydrogenase 14-like [Ruditapes philippinarum]|uniref:17-beta-hydroxysteroid dehydrogenase 14-like n=1 Tax=Ruditapes philippinarum TaxID=129788 RepID=UPI00295AF784|nr:17-beta-hydroxysteroid dehydrogenase 14-like [Ruditapes philippinarum]
MSDANGLQNLRFRNKVAIVTGGCCGVGRGCVDVLVDEGGKVAVLDINDEVGTSLTSDGLPGELFFIHCDMNKEDDIKSAIEKVVEKYGHIDCLVNNVGTNPGSNPIDKLTVQGFRDLLNTNLVSYFAASKYALPYLRKTKGCIVNTGSIGSSAAALEMPSYCASKGGTIALTKALAIDEAKHGVRVNAVSPSIVDTPLFRKVIKEWGEEQAQIDMLASFTQLGRLSLPREIGKACLFLAVDATFTTGEELMCTGGSEIGYGVKQ